MVSFFSPLLLHFYHARVANLMLMCMINSIVLLLTLVGHKTEFMLSFFNSQRKQDIFYLCCKFDYRTFLLVDLFH